MDGKTYSAGTSLEIDCGKTFYLKTSDFSRANTTYSSGTLSGNLQDYTAYKITDSGSQNMAFFAVDKADTASFTVKFGPLDIRLQTEAKDSHTDSSQGTTYADSKFTDTVSYQKLTGQRIYRQRHSHGQGHRKAITVNGKAVTSEKTFTAEKSAGTVTLEYDLDASTLKGKTTVVFEEFYRRSEDSIACRPDR